MVRSIALSDHWRWVSTPRWARTSENVTSTCQRRTKIAMISSGASVVSVLKKACGARLPAGSRTSTQAGSAAAACRADTTGRCRW